MADANPQLITRCYWIGGTVAAVGFVIRLFARRLALVTFSGGYQSDMDSLRDRIDGCGVVLVLFGMAVVLLALHHHLRSSSPLHERRGFETLPVDRKD
jgi:hypothetical protein